MGLMVDSCVFIAAERNKLDLASFKQVNGPECHMASVSWSELRRGVHRASTSVIRARREEYLRSLMASFPIVDFSILEAEKHAAIVAELEAKGKGIGAYDSMIAATALAHDWSVATLNLSEFQRVPGLKVV